ncbi:MAG: alpha/beta fold hydrolase [Acidimicrobiales bacterium]
MTEHAPDPDWSTLDRPDATIEWCRWPRPSAPIGRILVAHGANEHAARYGRFAAIAREAGWEVCGVDHRGHGRTADEHGAFGVARPGGWEAMVDDLIALADHLDDELPLVLFGHSMGSLLAQRVIQLAGDRFAGVILSGTSGNLDGAAELEAILLAVEEAEGADQPSALFAGMFAGFNETFAATTSEPTGFEWLSRDADEVAIYVADPWCGGDLSNGFVTDMIRGMATMWDPAAEAMIPRTLPVLFIAGDQDPVGGFGESVRALHDRYGADGIGPLVLRLYPDARHELLNETNRDEVHADLLDWLGDLNGR